MTLKNLKNYSYSIAKMIIMAWQGMAKEKIVKYLILVSYLIFISCGTVSSVCPLGRGKSALTVSSGGPVTEIFGIKMPIPYSVVRYRRGMTDNTDLHFGIHTTMLVMGNIGLDFGMTKQFILQSGWRPATSLELSIYGFYHMHKLNTIRAFPSLSLIGHYQLTELKHTLYWGAQGIFQYTSPILIVALVFGGEIPTGKRVLVNLETKWYAPNEPSEKRVVDYELKPFDYGAIGFVWGLSYKF